MKLRLKKISKIVIKQTKGENHYSDLLQSIGYQGCFCDHAQTTNSASSMTLDRLASRISGQNGRSIENDPRGTQRVNGCPIF